MSDLPYTYTDEVPDRGGDVIDDIRAALARPGGLSDEHRAFYTEIIHRFDGLAADRDQVRVTRDRYRDERDRLRTAWESARRGRAQAYRQLDEARRWGRILEAQRKDLRREVRAESARVSALRIAYQAAKDADLPEEGMVEPGDDAPALAELEERVERLALGLSETTKAVMKRLATVEAPAQYRDADGALWEELLPGHLFLSTRGMTGRPYHVVNDTWVPLTPATNETSGGAE